MWRKTRKLNILLTVLLVCIMVLSPIFEKWVLAEGTESSKEKTQLIFLLDASKSMQKEKRWMDIADSVCMMWAALPERYEAAMLVYNSEIVYQEDFGTISQSTRDALEHVKLNGYTSPGIALERAVSMFDTDVTNKRVVFISDGEISMPDAGATQEAGDFYVNAAEAAAEHNIKIDMFVIPNQDTRNEVSYGTEVTSGELYTAGTSRTLEEIAVTYLFDLLQIERIDLGESQSDQGTIKVDLQDTYMKSARILLVAEGDLRNFHVAGQCETSSTLQGNKIAAATLANPIEQQVTIEYALENRARVHAYLMKEYDLRAEIAPSYTSEHGTFEIGVSILNHQGEKVLDAENLKDKIICSINGVDADYRVENKEAVIPYQTAETETITVEVHAGMPGRMIYIPAISTAVELTVPVKEAPNYTVLWVVLLVLSGITLILIVIYQNTMKKKKSAEALVQKETKKVADIITYDFSGQIAVYLLKGELGDDIPPKSIKLFGMLRSSMTFAWIKDQCRIPYKLNDADKIEFFGGKDHTLCFRNRGYATVVKSDDILRRNETYTLYYGEKLLMLFNDGRTELELHYKKIKPSER